MKDKLAFFRRPWAITEEAFEILAGYDLDRCEESPALREVSLEDFEEKLIFDEANGVATLDIKGPVMPSPSLLARFFMGAVDTRKVEALIRQAGEHPDIKAVVLKLDTPGGAVTGTPEVGNAVAEVAKKKPVYAFTDGMVASAGYWFAAPATEIVATESALLGSIGVIRPHVDLTGARKQAGITVTLFTSGKHKAAGAMATTMTDAQAKAVQESVDDLGAKFRAHVSAHRPGIKTGDMEGRTYYGPDAKAKGFADRIVANFAEFYAGVVRAASEELDPGAAEISARVDTPEEVIAGDTAPDTLMENENQPETPDAVETDEVIDEPEAVETPDAPEAEDATDAAEGDAEDHAEADAPEAEDAPESNPVLDAINALAGKVDSLAERLDKIEQPEEEPDAEEPSRDDKVAREAARIAAESASPDAADVTSSGDVDADELAEVNAMTDAEKWVRYGKIREEKGDAAASEFYKSHLTV